MKGQFSLDERIDIAVQAGVLPVWFSWRLLDTKEGISKNTHRPPPRPEVLNQRTSKQTIIGKIHQRANYSMSNIWFWTRYKKTLCSLSKRCPTEDLSSLWTQFLITLQFPSQSSNNKEWKKFPPWSRPEPFNILHIWKLWHTLKEHFHWYASFFILIITKVLCSFKTCQNLRSSHQYDSQHQSINNEKHLWRKTLKVEFWLWS